MLGRHILLVEVILPRSLDDLIIDIRDVHHVEDVVAEVVLEDAAQDVEGEVGAGVAHVRGVVDGGAAVVPRHPLPAPLRHKRLLPARAQESFSYRLEIGTVLRAVLRSRSISVRLQLRLRLQLVKNSGSGSSSENFPHIIKKNSTIFMVLKNFSCFLKT
jgi:hypothetical protein